jgi:threonine dehydratase
LAAERGLTLIPPYDHPDIIAGQGTAALELLEQVGELDRLYVPCGGGGLLSGSALAVARHSPGCSVIGVEPTTADDAARSFRSKSLQTVSHPETIADGARTSSLGSLTFPLVLQYVNDMLTVNDDALIRTMFLLWERLKVIVEPTGALGAAAVLAAAYQDRNDFAGARDGNVPDARHRGQVPRPLRVGVILSGGNVDLPRLLDTFPLR